MLVPNDARAHNEARTGSCSLPRSDIKTIALSSAAAKTAQDMTVFRSVTRFGRAGEATTSDAFVIICRRRQGAARAPSLRARQPILVQVAQDDRRRSCTRALAAP